MSFCVKCGIDCEDTINGLCLECFLNGRELMKLPHHVDLQRCTNCEEYLIRERWVPMDEADAVEETAISGISLIAEGELISVGTFADKQDDRTFQVTIQADIGVGGRITEAECKTLVRLKNTVCKKCSRQLGNYYEATLQIRSGDKGLTDELRDETVRRVRDSVELQSKTNRGLFITKVQEVRGGVDIQLSSTSLARSLTKDLIEAYGAESQESASLVGQTSDGLEMYRLTFLVRLPSYHIGDILEMNGKPHILSGLNKTGGRLTSLNDFRDTSARKNEIQAMKILAKVSDRKEAVVLTSSDNEVQVMHPTNYSTIDLRIPQGAEIGEMVQVVQIEEVLYYVP
ncbi:MAG: hypothetical protein J6V08_06050 [Candidatus Methanomethylophilaceae archaeon]|nr:hypothetical protein [Candidatus Methanomethylophilaceae archaeon]MBO7205960.1 hypothetical protein [Candidatus Methanomethylophilaceae archaeon]